MHSLASHFVKSFFICCVLILLAACAATRPNIQVPKAPPPVAVIIHRPQVALVLGGGGARGFAHIGVIKVLKQYHVPIDLIVGTSAGSMVGSVYADDPNVHHLIKVLKQAGPSTLVDISAFHLLQGPITGDALQSFILKHVKARTFNQLKIPFIAVTTDLQTGATVPLSSGPIAPAINASSALPPFFRPVHLYGRIFVDGGTTDPVPVDIARLYHPKVIIAVTIVEDVPKAMPTNIVGVYDRAYAISDLRFNKFSTLGADVVLHPDVGQTGVFDASHKRALIKAGEQATLKALPQICAALKRNHIASDCDKM